MSQEPISAMPVIGIDGAPGQSGRDQLSGI